MRCQYWILGMVSLLLVACGRYYPDQFQARPYYVQLTKGQIEYYQIGLGSPIILIPGYATDVSSWNRDFLAELANQHRLIIINNRNIGRSSIASSQYHSADLAQDVHQLIQSLHLGKPAILGISMGGMIAQHFAVLYPDRIGQLILINTAIAGKQAVRPNVQIQKELLHLPMSEFQFYRLAIKLFFPASWRNKMSYSLFFDRFQPQNLLPVKRDENLVKQQALLWYWGGDESLARKIASITTPTLILTGEADSVIPPINSQILLDKIKHARLIQWKDGGHAMIYQYPKEIANVINAFIAIKN